MDWKKRGYMALAGMIFLGSSLSVSAEEVTPAGYHVYEVADSEVSDTWYGVARGDYLQAGMSRLSEYDDNHAVCTGYTFAHFDCDRVYVRIYLDQSETAESGTWGNVDYWTDVTNGESTASVSSGAYKIDQGYYYRVQGAHSVTMGDVLEGTTTCTNALYFD